MLPAHERVFGYTMNGRSSRRHTLPHFDVVVDVNINSSVTQLALLAKSEKYEMKLRKSSVLGAPCAAAHYFFKFHSRKCENFVTPLFVKRNGTFF